MQPGSGARQGDPLPGQPHPHPQPHRRNAQLQPPAAAVARAGRPGAGLPGGHGRRRGGLGEQGGAEAEGAGGGQGPGRPDGEDHEVVVGLHGQLEREVEQGENMTDRCSGWFESTKKKKSLISASSTTNQQITR